MKTISALEENINLPAIHSIEANTEKQMTRYFISGCWFSDAINEVWLDNEDLFNRPTQCTLSEQHLQDNK